MRRLLVPVLLVSVTSCSCATVREAKTEPPADGVAKSVRDADSLVTAVAVPIAASPEAVWSILVDGAGWTSWNSTIQSLSGTIALGEQVELVTKANPDRTFQLAVSELSAPQKMVWEDGMPLGLFSGVRTYRLQPQPDGTTLFTMSEVFSGGLLGSIEGSLPDMKPTFSTFAADLKKRAERDAAPSPPPSSPPSAPAEAPPTAP